MCPHLKVWEMDLDTIIPHMKWISLYISICFILTFVCPCIASIIVNADQQEATILDYLFIPSQLYVFWAMSLPIIRRTWQYLQLLILNTDIAACWYHGWDGTDLISILFTIPACSNIDGQYRKLCILSSAPDDGRRHHPRHVELTRNK